MSGKQSGLLAKQDAIKRELIHSTERIVEQFMTDTLQIAANRSRGFGYDRLMSLMEDWKQVQKEYRPALSPTRNVEADVAQEHMDRDLSRIINGKAELIPFAERYPELKRITYGRKNGRT